MVGVTPHRHTASHPSRSRISKRGGSVLGAVWCILSGARSVGRSVAERTNQGSGAWTPTTKGARCRGRASPRLGSSAWCGYTGTACPHITNGQHTLLESHHTPTLVSARGFRIPSGVNLLIINSGLDRTFLESYRIWGLF